MCIITEGFVSFVLSISIQMFRSGDYKAIASIYQLMLVKFKFQTYTTEKRYLKMDKIMY